MAALPPPALGSLALPPTAGLPAPRNSPQLAGAHGRLPSNASLFRMPTCWSRMMSDRPGFPFRHQGAKTHQPGLGLALSIAATTGAEHKPWGRLPQQLKAVHPEKLH